MHIIEVDAENWTNVSDFYRAILTAVAAPPGHGKSIDALIDSMVWGGMNQVDPPYTIRIRNLGRVPTVILDMVELAKREIANARAEYLRRNGRDVDVELETFL